MWVNKNKNWNANHTCLSKYFIEKIKQKVDPTEIVTNRHRTTNGFTLFSEIILVTSLVKKNPKFRGRLASLICEASSSIIKNNIVNDKIIKKYFPDIVKFIQQSHTENFEKTINLNTFLHKCKVKFDRVGKHYYAY